MNCPNCGTYIYTTELLDSEFESNCYYDFVEGRCPKCGKIYDWTEVYTFNRIEDVEEVRPDE